MAASSDYVEGIRKGLDEAFRNAPEQPFDPAKQRIVIFSDHHKGSGDPADDFRRCEHAYTAALGYYLEAGYRLFVLGDAEELWEESAEKVIARYRSVMDLEARFVRDGEGMERFYGNHDDQWASQKNVDKHLKPIFGKLEVREALRLRVARPANVAGTLFLVHGHQGTADSDRFGAVSRLVVRHAWRPLQRRFGFTATTPARDFELRAKHDRAMFEWARNQAPGVVLVAGHTHRPVFARSVPDPPPTRPIKELEAALEAAKAGGDQTAAATLRAELEYARTSVRRPDKVLTVRPPCYFNTGCCSFPDGDVTGLELADGEIRLVRWPANIRELKPQGGGVEPQRRILVAEQLETIFASVSGPAPPTAGAVEVEVRPD